MRYGNMIKQIESFKYSCSLKYDISTGNKLDQYIPTNNIVGVFQEIFYDTIGHENNRLASRLIYGTYGSGKSSFLTVLASILGKSSGEESYEKFFRRVGFLNQKLSNDLKSYVKNSKPFLIVPIDGHMSDFKQNIYYSIIKTLEHKNISCKINSIYFEASKIVRKWGKENNKEFKNILFTALKKHHINIPQLSEGLLGFNKNALEVFEGVFHDITFGLEFNPKINNLYENLDKVNKRILECGYRGILFIFDEFGKYLEDNIDDLKVKDIQDIAEYCDHSGYNNYIILVSHKEILQYVQDDRLEEWKKVESRFKPISFHLDDQEAIYLMKNALYKEKLLWADFKERYSHRFDGFMDEITGMAIFKNIKGNLRENIVEGIYPLHPIVGQMLIMLSEKIAQNERTIFTFLASNEENSMGNFINTTSLNRFRFIGGDILYDYFTGNLNFNRGTKEFSEWIKVQNALNKLEKDDEKFHIKVKIIKALGVINIISNYETIRPDHSILKSIIDENKNNIHDAITELTNDKLIIYIRKYRYYRFFDASSIDIEGLVKETMEISDNTEQAVELINERYVKAPILPAKYNNKYKMTRYYYPIYTLDRDIDRVKGLIKEKSYDGLLIYVFSNKDVKELADSLKGKRIIYVYTQDGNKILYEAKKLIAIEYLLTQRKELMKKDPKAIVELEEYKKEVNLYVGNLILEWSKPENSNNIYVEDGYVLTNINSPNSLSEHMSKKMCKHFNRTLIVNNELINKRTLSSTMTKVRKEIVDNILIRDKITPYLGYKPLSANYTFVRSLLVINEILVEDTIGLPNPVGGDKRIINAKYIMEEINKFIKKAEQKEILFYEIIDVLKKEPFGLRDGYIIVLIASALRYYRKSIYIRLKGRDQQLNGDLFERICKNPKYYTLSINYWNEDKEKFILGLENLYINHINLYQQRMNRLKALHDGILEHYKSISKFSRTTNKYAKEDTIKYRRLLEEEVENYQDFFFNRLFELASKGIYVLDKITSSKIDLENLQQLLVMDLIDEFKKVFNLENSVSIIIQLKNQLKINWNKRRKEDIEFITGKLIEIIENTDKSIGDRKFIEIIGKLSTGFEINYWGDKQREDFSNTIQVIYSDLEQTSSGSGLLDGEMKIAIEDKEGLIRTTNIMKKPLSENGQILKNLILANIDNFGQSLDPESKKQIIYQVLMKYI